MKILAASSFIHATPLFEKVPGANLETLSLIARQKPESLELEANMQIVSLDIKKLYTNVPVSESIKVALQCLYSIDTRPNIERSTLKLQLKVAVTNFYFKSNRSWYC